MEVMNLIRALWDKDEHGENLTVISFSLECMDEITGELKKVIKEVTTREPMASIADIGGYTTIRITYKYNSSTDFAHMRTIADDFSEIMTKFLYSPDKEEGIPCLRVVIRPMSIRGAMISAVNPVFHNIQPHDPMYSECNELQLLFLPDSVGYFVDENFDEEAASGAIQSEMAAEDMANRNAEKKKAEKEAYQEERDREMQERLSKNYDMQGEHIIKKAYHGYGKDRDDMNE